MNHSHPHNSTIQDHNIDPSLREGSQQLFNLIDEKPDDLDGHIHIPQQSSEHEQNRIDEATASAITASLAESLQSPIISDPIATQDPNITHALHHLEDGSNEDNPIYSAPPQIAPFSRPERNENTAHPLYYQFESREEFDAWLRGESSWCHFVQRRSTTPEKRAEERLKAREKLHERIVSGQSENHWRREAQFN